MQNTGPWMMLLQGAKNQIMILMYWLVVWDRYVSLYKVLEPTSKASNKISGTHLQD